MMRVCTVLLVSVLIAAPARAAYTTATVKAIAPASSFGVQIVITCSGATAGEPDPFDVSLALSGNVATKEDFAQQVWALCDGTAKNTTIARLLAVGATIPRPPAAAPPTREQVFWNHVAQYYAVDQAVKAGLVPVSDPNYIALKAKVLSEFVSAYVLDEGWPR